MYMHNAYVHVYALFVMHYVYVYVYLYVYVCTCMYMGDSSGLVDEQDGMPAVQILAPLMQLHPDIKVDSVFIALQKPECTIQVEHKIIYCAKKI
jgi:hypothetical protein